MDTGVVPEFGRCVPYFEQVLGGFPGKRVLSLGCDDGVVAQELSASGAEVVTIDHRSSSAEAFEGHESFDAVIVIDAFEQFEDIDDLIAACARVLRAGGVLGFVTSNHRLGGFELAERLAAQGLPTADITVAGLYLGYAVKP